SRHTDHRAVETRRRPASADPERHTAGVRLCAARSPARDCRRAQPDAGRGLRRRLLLSRLPREAGWPARAQALPRRSLPVDGRRCHCRKAAGTPGHQVRRDGGGWLGHARRGLLPGPVRLFAFRHARWRGDRPAGRGESRGDRCGGAGMTATIYIPRDSGALALGAEKVAKAVTDEIAARGIEAKIVRNGSRGLYWLEPMVEVQTASGRMAYGPVKPSDVRSL